MPQPDTPSPWDHLLSLSNEWQPIIERIGDTGHVDTSHPPLLKVNPSAQVLPIPLVGGLKPALKSRGPRSIRPGVSGLMASAGRSVKRFVRRALIAGVVLAVVVLAAAVTATALPGADPA